MKHFDPNTFLTDLSHNLNNVNPEIGEVNTLSDKFVKVFNDTLDKHAPYRYASKKEQRSFQTMAHQRHFNFHCKKEYPLQKAVDYKQPKYY